ncbi:HPP family protein [Candidatus Brocadiaceae bacterium B188]|nr:HPP family protein [Candidatus Brocadiaceae bacterium]RZV57904.1 MAG: HPP family protein [Candidatus Brocadia sp. BROELEC01]TWU53791.1 HPP family protein [Candidatus Brocadiaceae bacterium B188]
MFMKKKTSETRNVIDVKFRIEKDIEEKKRGCVTRVTDFLGESSRGERKNMPVLDGISKTISDCMKLPRAPQPVLTSREVVLSFCGAMLGIGVTALMAFIWKCPMLLGSFGSTAPLIYCAYKSPLAQPRNVVLGHFLGASIGVVVNDFFGVVWWSIALAVALAILLMFVTYSIHPPAGATAYVAIQTGGLGNGYLFILNPTMVGIFIMLTIAIIFNKMSKREYPLHWW